MPERLSEIFILLYKHIKQILEDHLNTEYLYMNLVHKFLQCSARVQIQFMEFLGFWNMAEWVTQKSIK